MNNAKEDTNVEHMQHMNLVTYCMCSVFCTSSVCETMGSSQASYQSLHLTASHKEMIKSNFVTENTSQIHMHL